MKNGIPAICLLIGIAVGFMPGEWKGQADTLRTYVVAPAIDPTYANDLADDAVYRARAPMAVKKR